MTLTVAVNLLWSAEHAGQDAGRLTAEESEALQVLIDHARQCSEHMEQAEAMIESQAEIIEDLRRQLDENAA